MNRIYQGKVTQVEIPDPDFLSAVNTALRSRERERVVEDRVRDVGEKREFAERTEVRCRSQRWLLFHRDSDTAREMARRASYFRLSFLRNLKPEHPLYRSLEARTARGEIEQAEE